MLLELSDRDARRLSRELRLGTHRHLSRRRRLLALDLVASASLGLIALFQMGLLRHLPEPRLPGLDADEVDASAEAYRRFAMPDAVLGLLSYAVTLALTAAGNSRRAAEHPWLPLVLGVKVGIDVFQAGKLTIHQWTRHRAFCIWCLIAAAATFATAPLALPEAQEALGRVKADLKRG